MKKSWTIIRCYLFIVVALIVCLLLFGCKTQYVPVETIRTVTVTKTDSFIEKDSVFCHDSVFVQAKGDTLLVEKWHTKYVDRWRDKVRIDSFIKVDSVQVPYPVEKKLTKWQQFTLDYGKVAFGGSLVAIAIIIFELVRWLRRRDK
jgi:hypothetical protein